jgi:hypothetical protein
MSNKGHFSCYVLLEEIDSKKYIKGYTQYKQEALDYIAQGSQYSYTHWSTKISGFTINGKTIKFNNYPTTEFIDNRSVDEKRNAAYCLECDCLVANVMGCLDDGDNEADAKALWRSLRQEIKTKYPKS